VLILVEIEHGHELVFDGIHGSRFYIIRLFGSRTPHQLADSSVMEMEFILASGPLPRAECGEIEIITNGSLSFPNWLCLRVK
jgi:hypothetical protein